MQSKPSLPHCSGGSSRARPDRLGGDTPDICIPRRLLLGFIILIAIELGENANIGLHRFGSTMCPKKRRLF